MNVLSLFDGISVGQLALKRAGLFVDKYYASEIDKYAIKVAQNNFPDTILLGDIKTLDLSKLPNIDLLIGGSPCTDFSFAGKMKGASSKCGIKITTLKQYLDLKNNNFEFEGQSYLFWEYIRILKELNPKYFLLENVVMKKEWENVITETLGVKPILINSNLLSAQNRKRLYWTNIPNVAQPEDKKITWGDVREHGVELRQIYYTDKAMDWIGRHGTRKGKVLKVHTDVEKMQMVEASHCKKYSSQRFFGIIDAPPIVDKAGFSAQIMGRRLNSEGHREDYNKDIKTTQCLEVRGGDKIGCLTTVRKDTVISQLPKGRYPNVFKELEEGTHYRYITPLECERLQTLPDNYTLCDGVSNTQRYKMIGNSWTADVIVHIFKNINLS